MEKLFTQAIVKSADEESGTFIASISSEKLDRMGDKISVDGWDFKNFKKNPVILWAHNNYIPPIARAKKIWVENNEVMMEGEWAESEFAQEIKSLVQTGFLNAMSVGFNPLTAPEWDLKGNRIFPKNELLEVSWVAVPALASALVQSRKLNLALVTKELEDISREQEAAELKSSITEVMGVMKLFVTEANKAIVAIQEAGAAAPKKGDELPEVQGRSSEQKKALKQKVDVDLKLLNIVDKAMESMRLRIIKDYKENKN